MSNKKISIVMPVFNTGVFLHESVDSVLNQQTFGDCDLPPLELIIVDDRSDDLETIAILAPGTSVSASFGTGGKRGLPARATRESSRLLPNGLRSSMPMTSGFPMRLHYGGARSRAIPKSSGLPVSFAC
jgi:hypothetical protein